MGESSATFFYTQKGEPVTTRQIADAVQSKHRRPIITAEHTVSMSRLASFINRTFGLINIPVHKPPIRIPNTLPLGDAFIASVAMDALRREGVIGNRVFNRKYRRWTVFPPEKPSQPTKPPLSPSAKLLAERLSYLSSTK